MDASFTDDEVTAIFARHLPLYRRKPAGYQMQMLGGLAGVWAGHKKVLDVGGGTGVVAQAIHELLNCDVTTVDVAARFAPGLTIPHFTYDGQSLPFADRSFEAATLMNVVHHIPRCLRAPLLREIRRVCDGPIYIKDHLVARPLDRARLTILDVLGNAPFSGMIEAEYLTQTDWRELAQSAGYQLNLTAFGRYRAGLMAALFPNRLETLMCWRPVTITRPTSC